MVLIRVLKIIKRGHFSEFLGDALLDTIMEDLGDDWYKIYVMSGVPFSEIEEAILQSRQTTLVKTQVIIALLNL